MKNNKVIGHLVGDVLVVVQKVQHQTHNALKDHVKNNHVKSNHVKNNHVKSNRVKTNRVRTANVVIKGDINIRAAIDVHA